MSSNEMLDTILDIDPQYKICPQCGVVEPCLVHQPITGYAFQSGNVVTIVANNMGTVMTPQEVARLDPEEPTEQEEKLADDFEFSREKIRALVDLGREAAEKAKELAESGDSPRAYEVVGTLITSVVNASRELLEIHKARKEASNKTVAQTPSGTVNIEKAVFVGRASELIRELRALSKNKELAPAPPDVQE